MRTIVPSSPTRQQSPDPSAYTLDDETGAVLVPLGGKKHPGLFALVDIENAEAVFQHRWSPVRTQTRGVRELLYAKSRLRGSGRFAYLHRFVLGLTDPKVKVDHENHNGLDCRKSNLRLATHQQNIFNRRPNLNGASSYKGVYWYAPRQVWRARIKPDGKMHDLGEFHDEIQAALAYDIAAREHFGDFAYLNFPDQDEREVA